MQLDDKRLIELAKYAGIMINTVVIIFVLQHFNFGKYQTLVYLGVAMVTVLEFIFLSNLQKSGKIKTKNNKSNLFENSRFPLLPIQLFDSLIPKDHPGKAEMLAEFHHIKKIKKQIQIDQNTIDLEIINKDGNNHIYRMEYQLNSGEKPTITSFQKYK